MKKVISVILCLVLLCALIGCGSSGSGTSTAAAEPTAVPETAAAAEPTEAPAPEARKFVVGFDAEFPPFGFIADDGSYDGFDLALAKEVCARLGWEFEAVAIDWNAKDNELSSGNIDCIWNGFTCTGREEQYTWSDAYVDNSIVVIVKADSGIKSLADLAGKVLMVQAASSAAEAVYGNEDFHASLGEVIELAEYNSGFMELRQGTVDAVAADAGVAAYQVAHNPGDYVILDEAISTEQYAVGFLLGNTELRDIVNEQLLAIAADGTMLKIAENYVDDGLVLESLILVK